MEEDRLRDVEKSVQDTRERMIHGFGDIRLAISEQGKEITEKIGATEKALGEKIGATEKALGEKIGATEKALGEKIGATEKALGNQINAVDRSTRNRTLTIIAITIASIGIATGILVNVL